MLSPGPQWGIGRIGQRRYVRMKKVVVLGFALAMLMTASASAATAAGGPTRHVPKSATATNRLERTAGGRARPVQKTSTESRIGFRGAFGCNLRFGYQGFEPGTIGEVDLYYRGRIVHVFTFEVPTPGGTVSVMGVGKYIQHHMNGMAHTYTWDVSFTATTHGGGNEISGETTIVCNRNRRGGGGRRRG